MKKKLNLINLQKEEIKKKQMNAVRGGGLCGCFDDGVLFNRQRKRDNGGQFIRHY